MNSMNPVAKQLGLDADPNLNHSFPSMATRNRTLLYRKYRDALKTVRSPVSSSASASTSSGVGGSIIKLSLLMHKIDPMLRSVLKIPEKKPYTDKTAELKAEYKKTLETEADDAEDGDGEAEDVSEKECQRRK